MVGEKSDRFWADEDGKPLVLVGSIIEGTEVVLDGFRFRWTRNEFGQLYRRSLEAQVGYHTAKRYTIQEFASQARKMAEEHAEFLTPEMRAMVGREIMLQDAMAPMAMPVSYDISGQDSSAIFI